MNKRVFSILLPSMLLLSMLCSNAFAAGERFRDPTMPLGYQRANSVTAVSLDLQAIFGRSGDAQKAIINGSVVSIGQTVAGWTLVDIQAGKVVLHSRNAKQTLHLRKSVTN